MADKARVGDKKKRRVIRPPPTLVDEEERLEEVPPLKRTRGSTPSVSVAIVGGTSQVPDAIPSAPGTVKIIGSEPDDVEIVDSDGNMPESSRGLVMRDVGISPNYFRNPPILGSSSEIQPINPNTGVEYLCAHGQDLLRSGEISGYGKMSNVNRIRHGMAHIFQVILGAFFKR